MKKGTVGMDFTIKPTAAEVEAGHVTGDGVAGDSKPRAAICSIFPCCCLQVSNRAFISIIIVSCIKRKGGLEVKQGKTVMSVA